MTSTTTDRAARRGMPRPLRILGKVLLALVCALGLLAAFVYVKSEAGIGAHFSVQPPDLVIPSDADAIARGERLARTRGCLECHAANGAGQVFIDAMPVMVVRAPNITRGGATASWSGRDWVRAVRHGVLPDGSAIRFMPAEDYRMMDDADLGAIVAYLRSIPAVQNTVERTSIGPVGRLLYLKGELPFIPAERIDHQAPVPAAPPVGPTVEYGRYMANTCIGCHGPGFSGGHIPGTPPDWPDAANISPHAQGGYAGVSLEQFTTTVRTGARRSGGTIDPMHMPWRQFADFTDVEIAALYAFLQTVPARPTGTR